MVDVFISTPGQVVLCLTKKIPSRVPNVPQQSQGAPLWAPLPSRPADVSAPLRQVDVSLALLTTAARSSLYLNPSAGRDQVYYIHQWFQAEGFSTALLTVAAGPCLWMSNVHLKSCMVLPKMPKPAFPGSFFLFLYFSPVSFYRTQVSLGSDLWVLMSVTQSIQDHVLT